jgi:hypothetical protein
VFEPRFDERAVKKFLPILNIFLSIILVAIVK